MRLAPIVPLVAVALLVGVQGVAAQGVDDADAPIGRFVFDLNGVYSPWGQDAELAAARGFESSTQPGRGIGVGGGVHVYLFRWKFITFGLGATALWVSGSKTPSADDPVPDAPPLNKKLTALSSQLSFNFGGPDGWSYISGGPGTSRLSLYDRNAPEPPQRSAGTINFGGGARWFTSDHLAFALDLRFYTASELLETETEPGSPRATTLVLSIGASFK